MKRNFLWGLVCVVVLAGMSFAAKPAVEYREGYLLVKFKNTSLTSTANAERQALAQQACGGTIIKNFSIVPGLSLVQLPSGVSVTQARGNFIAGGNIWYAEPDYIGRYAAIPNDTQFNQLWGLNNTGQTVEGIAGLADADIDAPEAWNIVKNNATVIVAVCDSGIDITHPDLAANIWVNQKEATGQPGIDDDNNGYIDDINGWDFAYGDNQPEDNIGHGTHVAGTIGAVGNNGIGVTGINWSVKIVPVKIGDYFISMAGAIEGIQYAIKVGAKVMNHSWGGSGYSQALYDAITQSQAAGLLFVAASGNYSIDNDAFPFYPASYDLPSIISVMATNSLDVKTSFSHWGKNSVDIGAPGQSILSTVPNIGYEFYDGTSMASPHVTGACALTWSVNPSMTYTEVKDIILRSSDVLPSLRGLSVSEGRLNLYKAVNAAMVDVLPPLPDPAQWNIQPTATGLHHIVMKAATATDKSGVEYAFDCIENNAYDKTWQSSPLYEITNLPAGTTLTFRCKARDKSPNLNETQWSVQVSATTAIGVDNLPPAPSPLRWKAVPRVTRESRNEISMELETAYDENQVDYYIECPIATDGNGAAYKRGPQSSPVFTVYVSDVKTNEYTFVGYAKQRNNVPAGQDDKVKTLYTPDGKVGSSTKSVIREVPSAAYRTIQSAINAASNGDVVLVHRGVYREININFRGKPITVTSEDPNNPMIVASTVIDCAEPEQIYIHEARRAFLMQSGEGRNSILTGITIKNATAYDEAETRNPIVYSPMDTPDRDVPSMNDGMDAFGGAILLGSAFLPASPTIRNCVFVNCFAYGAYGTHGANATAVGNDRDGNHGNRGGHGGNAYGGAIYVYMGSSPLIDNCEFSNCQAIGGNAGNGGNGSNGGGHSDGVDEADGHRGGDGGDAGNGGCAWGGAIYMEPNCLPELRYVTVKDCFVKVGEAGYAGDGGNGSNAKSQGRGGHGGNGGIGGDLRNPDSSAGAIYYGVNTNAAITDCVFENCSVIAVLAGDYSGGDGGDGGDAQGSNNPADGGNGGHGGPAFIIPPKMQQIGGVDATGGTGGDAGNGAGGGTRGTGGNGGFRHGQGGTGQPNGGNFPSHTGIFPSNIYYMAYYWEDTMNIDNPPTDPNDHNSPLYPMSYTWEWEDEISDPTVTLPPTGTTPGEFEYSVQSRYIFDSAFSPYFGFLDQAVILHGAVNEDPNFPGDPDHYIYDYMNTFPVGQSAATEPLTPTNSAMPNTGGCAGANYYGENSTITMKNTTVSGNTSFANHGGGELYDRGCSATFENCIFQDNKTLPELPTGTVDTNYRYEGSGGGLFADQPVNLSFNKCKFINNEAFSGAGAYCNFKPSDPNYLPAITVTDCNFVDNKADYNFIYSYAGGLFVGNSLEPYEEYYFNYLKSSRYSNITDFLTLFFGDPVKYEEFINFIVSVYDHHHGYINFSNPITTTLWNDLVETDHVLAGQPPVYSIEVAKTWFEGNLAPYGAGLYVEASKVELSGSSFINNAGQVGGGSFLYASDITAKNNIFTKNIGSETEGISPFSKSEGATVQTDSVAAALYVSDSDAFMTNNKFLGNQSDDFAGGLLIKGPSLSGYPYSLFNSLFIENMAGIAGGGLMTDGGCDVEVLNCTFIDNQVTPGNVDGYGGAIAAQGLFMNITNTIFWDNLAFLGPQVAVGAPFGSYHLPATVYLDYSDIQFGKDYVFETPDGSWCNYLPNNIDQDPLFAQIIDPNDVTNRTFYLKQLAAGQLVTSPCVNTGSASLDIYDPDSAGFIIVSDVVTWLNGKLGFNGTTRTDNVADLVPIDMGYHYDSSLPILKYLLTAEVIIPDKYPHGTLNATWVNGGTLSVSTMPGTAIIQQGVEIALTAVPDTHYRVKRWIGTEDDMSFANTNTAIMAGNRTVSVEFELAIPRNRMVPSDYPTIMAAVQAAHDGDTVILAPRPDLPYVITTPTGEGIDLMGKNIIITSEDPNDPAIVAQTVLDCKGTRYVPQRAFVVRNGEGSNTVIQGLTVKNAVWVGAVGANASLNDPTPFPAGPDPVAPPRAAHGADATGNGYAGAILIENGSSPIIRNCVFDNCRVVGAWGGDGANGADNANSNHDGQSGGHGGWGTGNGYGGAIAVLDKSNPLILNCIFRNNSALGGSGGNGGKGGNATQGGRQSWGGNGGYAIGDGVGGAIFTDAECNTVIQDCTFEDNYARIGIPGTGGGTGTGGTYSNQYTPFSPSTPGATGLTYTYGGIRGGAVVLGEGSTATVLDSKFIENKAYNLDVVSWTWLLENVTVGTQSNEYLFYTRAGGIEVDPNSTVNLERLDLTNNRPTALEIGSGCTIVVKDSVFKGNADWDRTYLDYLVEPEQVVQLYNQYYPEYLQYSAGAIFINEDSNSVLIDGCSFNNNASKTYGGAINSKSDFTATNCEFSANESLSNGGAIDMYYYIPDPNTRTLALTLTNCTFTENKSNSWGGAIHAQNVEAVLNQCYFINNSGWSGGAMYLSDGLLQMGRSLFSNNTATGLTYYHRAVTGEGYAGALACMNNSATIVDTVFAGNRAQDGQGQGGAILFGGGNAAIEHRLDNCLFDGNYALKTGGAIAMTNSVKPVVNNCTINGNTTDGQAGGIFISLNSMPTLINSIFTNNTKYAVYEQSPSGNAVVRYCMFYGNPDGDYRDAQAGSLTVAQLNAIAGNAANRAANPLYVTGPLGDFYLNQTGFAVNTGSATAASLGLNTYTTDGSSDNGVLDSGIVDLGYHHPVAKNLPKFNLTVIVQDGRGTVTPASGTYYLGQKVDITVQVQPDYIITGWSGGTFDDSSIAAANSVIVTSDKTITVLVRQRKTYYVGGSSPFTELQQAIDAAQDGDDIKVLPGIYTPAVGTGGTYWGALVTVNLNGKSLKITGTNPADMEVVRATSFDHYQFNLINAPSDVLIEGITIRYGGMNISGGSPVIRNCVIRECRWAGGTTTKVLKCDSLILDGGNGGSVLGGAVSVSESSPTFINCYFEDNYAMGGNGQNATDGCTIHPVGGDGGWPGRAYGGAVYAAFSSEPVFESCTFTGNQVLGGTGGNGGNGIQNNPGGRGGGMTWPDTIENGLVFYWWDGWEEHDKYWFYSEYFKKYDWEVWQKWFGWTKWKNWDEFLASSEYAAYTTGALLKDGYEEYWKYSGYGGAVYCAFDTQAKFIKCSFDGNSSHGSLTGVGGNQAPSPNRQVNLPNAGGAVYAANDSKLEFEECQFRNNVSDRSTVEIPMTYQVSFGGAVAYEYNCEAVFNKCNFNNNEASVGGGIYAIRSQTTVVDSNSFDNYAHAGAGAYVEGDSISITNTKFEQNKALTPPAVIIPGENDNDPPTVRETLALAGQGAGLFIGSADLDLRHSTFIANQADISGGGLYITGEVAADSSIFNCLFDGNNAKRDGGGASVNWYAVSKFGNCTFAYNHSDGRSGDYSGPGSGGGLYCAYSGKVNVIDSIFWGNTGQDGSQITVGTGFEFDPRPAALTVSYTDIQGGNTATSVKVGTGSTLVYGAGNINASPGQVFVIGPDRYLDQSGACIDVGSNNASSLGMDGYTTSINGARDKGIVDLGYHYAIQLATSECQFADFVLNGVIDLGDMAVIARQWLGTCSKPDWCSGTDINTDTTVDIDDIHRFVPCWLERDNEVPTPPMWALTDPIVATFNTNDQLVLTGLPTKDNWFPESELQYRFLCVDPAGGPDSGWLNNPSHTFTGLTFGTKYIFNILAKDPVNNIAISLTTREANAGAQYWPQPGISNPPLPTEPLPVPDPVMTWAIMPAPVDQTRITMTATTIFYPQKVNLEYEYERYLGPVVAGGAQRTVKLQNYNTGDTFADNTPDTAYSVTPWIFTDTGLTNGQAYTYRVRVRYSTGVVSGPWTQWSLPGTATPQIVDNIPPTPNPSVIISAVKFNYNGTWYHIIEAEVAVDPSGVEYQFERTNGPAIDATWWNDQNVIGLLNPDGTARVPYMIWLNVGNQSLNYSYRVHTRDMSPLQNMGDWSVPVLAQ